MDDLFCIVCFREWEYFSVLLLSVTRPQVLEYSPGATTIGEVDTVLLSISRLCCLQKFPFPVRRQEPRIWGLFKMIRLLRSKHSVL